MSCIVYQLPNGKVVYLTVEQFLRLSDDDIKYLDSNDFGTTANNPFRKLPYADKDDSPANQVSEDALDHIQEDQSIDYNAADDDDDDSNDRDINFDQLV